MAGPRGKAGNHRSGVEGREMTSRWNEASIPPRIERHRRVLFNGRTSASQADDGGSIPLTRSRLLSIPSSLTDTPLRPARAGGRRHEPLPALGWRASDRPRSGSGPIPARTYQSEPPATSMSDMLMPRASSRHRKAARAAISAGGMVRFCG